MNGNLAAASGGQTFCKWRASNVLINYVETRITDDPQVAAEFIRAGSIVAFPTETVYGLGADAFNQQAIKKIFAAKGRPADNPLIAHIAEKNQLDLLAEAITASAASLIEAFFPGPLTVVLRKRAAVPDAASGGLDTIGIRMPSDRLARVFLAACETPVVAPSANLSGRPSPTSFQAVFEDLNGRIDCILRGMDTEIGLESTVVDCTGERAIILRPGAISIEMIREILPDAEIADSTRPEAVRSPGMKYRHYAPLGMIRIIGKGQSVTDAENAAFIGCSRRSENFRFRAECQSVDEYAAKLFEFLRECDRQGIGTIYCEAVAAEGIGRALMDRLRRAAGLTAS